MDYTLHTNCPNCQHQLGVTINDDYTPSHYSREIVTPSVYVPEQVGALTITGVDDATPVDPAPAPEPAPTPSPAPVPPGGTLYGLSMGSAPADFIKAEQTLGTQDVRSLFIPSFTLPGTLDLTSAPLSSRLALVNVKMDGLCKAIAAGGHDTDIFNMARWAKQYGASIWVRWGGEMDRRGDSVADYIAAWRRIVSTFRQQGASNVKHVWSPVMAGLVSGRAQPFYPGDGWVDIIGPDGYNVATGAWREFSTIVQPALAFAKANGNLPVAIPETGCRNQEGDTKRAQWVKNLGDFCKATPAIAAVCYFNRFDSTSGTDWRLGTESSAAWKALLA